MGIIDRHIFKKFLGTFFFILAMLMSIAVVFDFAEKFDEFHKASWSELLFEYYLNFIFYYSNLFSSLIIFLSVIFFTSKMARNNEIVAILNSGMSFNRMLRPYFFAATVLVGSSIYLNHFVLPNANKTRLAFEDRYQFHNVTQTNVHREVDKGVIIYFSSNNYRYVDEFFMDHWEDGKLKTVLYAQRAWGDTISNKWSLDRYLIRYIGENQDSLVTGDHLDTTFTFNVLDFAKRMEFSSSMTSPVLSEYIRKEKEQGNPNIVDYEIELHQRTAYPVAAYILTLIAVCVSGRKSRGGMGWNLMVGLIFAVVYIFSMRITSVAAAKAGLNPSLAVWIPNMLFLLFTIPLYRNAQK